MPEMRIIKIACIVAGCWFLTAAALAVVFARFMRIGRMIPRDSTFEDKPVSETEQREFAESALIVNEMSGPNESK